MDVSTLTPSPQTDVRVAVEVMGAEEFPSGKDYHSQVAAALRMNKLLIVPHAEGYKMPVTGWGAWRPSTEWRAAAEVIEFLRHRGTIIHVGPGLPGQYIARLSYEPNYVDPKARQFIATTGPLAVCMAALAPQRFLQAKK
ncbi:MAG: hypothetical protein JWL69_5183 [Phycisphaerales bacterium]|jgi:hypothetical protein|nr:hypothetical protein [Phycisphaerales bacterium]MDB5354747.1 hypothetical protein [Phycisphaerales bacterium]